MKVPSQPDGVVVKLFPVLRIATSQLRSYHQFEHPSRPKPNLVKEEPLFQQQRLDFAGRSRQRGAKEPQGNFARDMTRLRFEIKCQSGVGQDCKIWDKA
jgi:hypothetical protein